MQESKYDNSAQGTRCGGFYKRELKKGIALKVWNSKKKVNCVVTDYGIAQIFITSVKNFKLNPIRLMTDKAYNIEAGAIILADFHRMYHREVDYWTRYNASTRYKRDKYKKLVSQWL